MNQADRRPPLTTAFRRVTSGTLENYVNANVEASDRCQATSCLGIGSSSAAQRRSRMYNTGAT